MNVWKKVRIERRIADGTIRVFFDDMKKPIMAAEDKSFGAAGSARVRSTTPAG